MKLSIEKTDNLPDKKSFVIRGKYTYFVDYFTGNKEGIEDVMYITKYTRNDNEAIKYKIIYYWKKDYSLNDKGEWSWSAIGRYDTQNDNSKSGDYKFGNRKNSNITPTYVIQNIAKKYISDHLECLEK